MPNEKIKILLIEDDATLVEMYEMKFKESEFEILVADRGAQGLEIAEKQVPDIILLDIILPEMDGFAILRELKKDEKTKRIPVLLLSNLGQDSDIEKGKKLGAEDYLVKANYTPTQVVDMVRKYIKK